MPSTLYALSALSALLTLLRCVAAAPVAVDAPWGDTSGEDGDEVQTSRTQLSLVWDTAIRETSQHQKEFEDEFYNKVPYDILGTYNIPQLPQEKCPKTNFSKEACLRSLVQGLLTYSVLLKHVEKEYPSNTVPPRLRNYFSRLIGLINEQVQVPVEETVLSSSQEEQLLRGVDSSDTFRRRMMAHSIMYKLRPFLVDGIKEVNLWEKAQARKRAVTSVTFFTTMAA